MKNLESALLLVHDRKIDFGEFVTRTQGEYRSMARYLLQKWRMPTWFYTDDVVQELYVETWRIVQTYDGTRGATLARYVVYNVMVAAKRAMHKARGVGCHGNPGKRQSRIEIPFSVCEEEAIALLIEEPRVEDELIEASERTRAASRALKACVSQKERFTVLAIREAGSLDTAGRFLYNDVDHRTELRLGSEQHAERFVARHARAVAHRIEGEGVRTF